jgi:hypothetical protein
LEEAFSVVERRAAQWIRWMKEFEERVGDEGRTEVTLEDTPAAIQRSLRTVTADMQKLHKQVQRQLRRKHATPKKPNRRKKRRRS